MEYGGRVKSAAARRAGTASRDRLLERIAPIVAGIAILALWEFYVRTRLPEFVAKPSGIAMAMPSTLASESFWSAALMSFASIVEGVAIGSFFGIIIGVAMGRVREVNWFMSIYIRALYSLPLVALVPVVILLVGFQPAARLIIVAISAFLPVVVTTADGTRSIPKEYLEVGRMFGARTRHVWLGIALPTAMPHIVAGIEMGFARGITNAIAVEVLASIPGMGTSVFEKSAQLNENASFVYVLALAIFAIMIRSLMIRARRQLAPWYTG